MRSLVVSHTPHHESPDCALVAWGPTILAAACGTEFAAPTASTV